MLILASQSAIRLEIVLGRWQKSSVLNRIIREREGDWASSRHLVKAYGEFVRNHGGATLTILRQQVSQINSLVSCIRFCSEANLDSPLASASQSVRLCRKSHELGI